MDEEFDIEEAVDLSARTGKAVLVEWDESIEYLIGFLGDIGLHDYFFYPLDPPCSLMCVDGEEFRLIVRLSR